MFRSLLIALAATLAFHIVLLTAADIARVVTWTPPVEHEVHFDDVELIEPQPPPPPPPQPPPPPPPETKAAVDPVKSDAPPQPAKAPQQQVAHAPPHAERQVPTRPTATDIPSNATPEGTREPFREDNLTDASGKSIDAHAPAKRCTDCGSAVGGGSGSGGGTELAPAPAKPISIAVIKKRALPKGDYGFLAAGKDYPEEAKQQQIEGALRVRLVVDATGTVTGAVLLNKLGHGLDELALRQAKVIAFTPALDNDDQPVASVVVWTFNFTLPK